MVYRFQSPGRQPAVPAPSNYGAGGHRIANTLQMIRQAMDRRKRLEHDKQVAEQQAKQASIKSALDRRKLAAQIEDWEAGRKNAERQIGLQENQFKAAQGQRAAEMYEKQQQLLQADRPGQAEALSGIGANMPLMEKIAPQVVALKKAAEARRQEEAQKSGLEMVDDVLEQPEEAGPQHTEAFTRAQGEVQSALEPMLESDDPDEAAAAAVVMDSVPGLLASFRGDTEKAVKEAQRRAKEGARRRAKERQSRRGAAAARAAGSGNKAFDDISYRRGVKTVQEATRFADGKVHTNNFAMARAAIDALDKFGENPKVFGGLLFSAAQALSGQEGRGMSDKDAEKIMGESIAEMAQGTFMQKLMGKSGEVRRRELRDLLEASMEKSYQQASSAFERSKAAASAASSAAGGREGGRDFMAGAKDGLLTYGPVLEEMQARERAQEERRRKTGSKLSKEDLLKMSDEEMMELSEEELESLLGE